MAFRKAMTGGACQPDGTQSGLSQNAFTSMMDQFITGNAQARQMSEGYGAQMNQQNNMILEKQYQDMMKQDFMNAQFEQMRLQEQMHQPAQQNHFQHLINRPSAQAEMNSIWDQVTQQPMQYQNPQNIQTLAQDQMPGGLMQFQQPWMNPMMATPFYANPMMQQRQFQQNVNATQENMSTSKDPVLVEEYPPAEEDLLKNEIKSTTNNMVKVLETSDNPKHRNSKFLKFLRKIEHGAYAIENDQLVKKADKIAEFKKLEELRLKEEALREQEESKEQINTISDKTNMFSKLWNQDDQVTDEQFEEMMKQWDSEGQDDKLQDMFMEEWGKQWSMEQPENADVIPFEANNKYKDLENKLKLAKDLVEEGKGQEAIKCLQAEVSKNPDNAEAWRLMGQLYQENDQDDYAILAFKKAYEIDPYDLDSLLCLGISCTNELEQKEAVQHLQGYLKYHPEYSSLISNMKIQNDKVEFDDVREAYRQAFAKNPKDSSLCLAMGVLCFIQRNFAEAVVHFENGIKENPTDHTLWNKYGAALANNLNIDKAIRVYHQALDLRPNYVRTLANIGLAHRNQMRFAESIPFFLNALLLNPQATHIWRYIRSSFIQMNRLDLIEKMNYKDPNMFRDEFQLIQPDQLQKPSLERLYENEIWSQ